VPSKRISPEAAEHQKTKRAVLTVVFAKFIGSLNYGGSRGECLQIDGGGSDLPSVIKLRNVLDCQAKILEGVMDRARVRLTQIIVIIFRLFPC
jgi:hypothetical protein